MFSTKYYILASTNAMQCNGTCKDKNVTFKNIKLQVL